MTTLTRLPDWQVRMEAFVLARRTMPFAWGSNDCALFAADMVQALTGQDVVPPALRGVHTSERDAWRVVRAAGGLEALADAALGTRVMLRRAGVGDVVLLPMGQRQALGICNGQTVIGPGRDGIVAFPMDGALAAWRVG